MPAAKARQQLHIAIFECLRLAPEVVKFRGEFGPVFNAWLQSSVAQFNASPRISEQIGVKTSFWDVEHGQFPKSLGDVDGIIVTGSTASAYDKDPWIPSLEKYLKDVYHNHQHVRIFGGCFGHQILSQALLGDRGAYVEKSPHGWEIGVHSVKLTEAFKNDFKSIQELDDLSFQFLHADHVVLPSQGLTEGWTSIGDSSLCGVQGVYKRGRVLTYQGHPEFDEYLNEAAVVKLGETGTLAAGQVKDAVRQIRNADKRILAGVVLLEFLTARQGHEIIR